MSRNGRGVRRLTVTAAKVSNQDPSFAADATGIGFSSDRSGHCEVYRMIASGGRVRQVRHTSAATSNTEPAWQP
jgi:Tol biopolymer transport system component